MEKPKVTGIGGIFFKCDDPNKMREWYAQQLGLDTDQYGAMFKWRTVEDPSQIAYTQWSTFSKDSNHMSPSQKEFMINYRVNDLEKLLDNLRKKGVKIIGNIEQFDYGKFAHIMDPEGNKIELWEPIDKAFDSYYEQQND